MHTVELLEQAMDLAQRAGYRIRQEWMAGNVGGGCVLRGQKWIFLDLALGPADQLEQITDALRHDPEAVQLPMPHSLRELLQVRKTA